VEVEDTYNAKAEAGQPQISLPPQGHKEANDVVRLLDSSPYQRESFSSARDHRNTEQVEEIHASMRLPVFREQLLMSNAGRSAEGQYFSVIQYCRTIEIEMMCFHRHYAIVFSSS